MKKLLEDNEYLFLVFRVIIGLGFFLHGLMKAPGILEGKTSFFSLIFFAALIELVGGLFIIVGLFTRTTATIAALEMAYAFVFVHAASGGLNPLANRGEAAMLYFAAFIVLMIFGGRRFSLDKMIFKD